MSDTERKDIIDAMKELPEADKQFMLGYAAGRAASVKAETQAEEAEQKEAPANG